MFVKLRLTNFFKHCHKWQDRGQNPWGKITYRVCLKCGQAQCWEGMSDGVFVDCERIPELDNQFDSNNMYKFNLNNQQN